MMVISTSKIKKTTVIIKNRNEKELRILWFGSNPHSNALNFSRFMCCDGVFRKKDKKRRIKHSITNVHKINDNIKIFLVDLSNWKLDILNIIIF